MHFTPILKKSSATAFDLRDCSSITLFNYERICRNLIKIYNCLLVQSKPQQLNSQSQLAMPFIPKNARQILKSAALQKQFFLKPFGLTPPTNKNAPVLGPTKKFIDLNIVLHRPGKEVSENTLTFKCDQTLSKPQIKQYISKLYNVNVEKVNTARFMGKVFRSMTHRPKKAKNFKKAFVVTSQKFDPFLNTSSD